MTDPLQKSGPELQRDLFNKLASQATGYNAEDVIGAALNVAVNAIRQSHAQRSEAESSYDNWFGKTKSLLLEHYDSVTGRRRSFFPHHQTIEVPLFDFSKQKKF